jgi:transcription-repair coupling factor (superfamily II helicase)
MLWTETIENSFRTRVDTLLAAGKACHVPDLPLSGEAFLVWELVRSTECAVLWIADGPRVLEAMVRDLRTLSPPMAPTLLRFPSWEALPDNKTPAPDAGVVGARLEVLAAFADSRTPVVVATCAQALMELTLAPATAAENTCDLRAGEECDPAELAQRLTDALYVFNPEVQSPGEASLRGGILDVWPLTARWPLRLEFLGTTLESIRTFDPLNQRSLEHLREARLTPVGEWRLMRNSVANRVPFVRHLPANTIVVWSDIESIQHHADVYDAAIREAEAGALTVSLSVTRIHFDEQTAARQVFIGSAPEPPVPSIELDLREVDGIGAVKRDHLHPDIVEAARSRFLTDVATRARQGQTVGFYFDTQGTRERFRELYAEAFVEAPIASAVGTLSGGFRSDEMQLVIVAESDLYGRRIQRKRLPSAKGATGSAGARISDWTDMEPGNLVVHVEHGIGRYLGLREIKVNERLQEVLAIEYAEGARLYVPVSQAHLLTRYVGVGKRFVTLHHIGGKRWSREKEAADKAVHDLASILLETQAARAALGGFAFPRDAPWQHELEAAFPYEETEDQEAAIRSVKTDMEAPQPMDRLLCGDAGYGKTEVAVRAAFKAVMAGKQVAVLVPTTVLAQQHFQTFTERIAPFPVRIEMLSRFCTHTQSAKTAEGLKEGTVDIVIGTHALLQPDIAFHDLGLVIIDEEQRFGVLHKERFKHIRRLVDVLTLTATPIPRTLYMSLTGARDLSTIQTPPQDRLAVETVVAPASDLVIREAILREINREGQVFYLHNRVRTIERVRGHLQQLVPEARVEVAHGQMPSGALAEIMRSFAQGEFDVLLCTTIIESGLDIPNANTILIDRADRFGLADLYQLRGRVGRSRHRAFAYMLLPTQAHVDPIARKRIQAIKQYSGAGAGFRVAMRDLEIRGAGNLLGSEQSGHIAAVGFGLYCQLLKRTIAQAKGEPLSRIVDVQVSLDFVTLSPADAGAEHSAVIPLGFIEDERLRVSLYRRIAEAASVRDVEELRRDIKDRFGRMPKEVDRLLKIAEMRVLAAERSVQSIETQEDKIMLKREGDYLMAGGRFPRLRKSSPDARLDELLAHLRRLAA